MKRIILITGGQRSGKSSKAEELALQLSDNPVYLATAHIWDEEFKERVRRHQERRGPQWTNIEEEIHLSKHDLTGRVVVIDCVTLWLTNWLVSDPSLSPNPNTVANGDSLPFVGPEPHSGAPLKTPVALVGEGNLNVDAILAKAKEEFDKFTKHDATYIFVTNEIGSGGVSDNALQRRFTDLQGWMNQYIAQKADEVILMVSGIPLKIKK